MAEVDKFTRIKTLIEAYGTGVRAGVITPCLQDENEFRQLLGLQSAPVQVEEDWNLSKGIRRPITLARPQETIGADPEAVDIHIEGVEDMQDTEGVPEDEAE